MILYLDGAALVGLYVQNEHSGPLRGRISEASIVATSVVAFTEVCAALSSYHQRNALTARQHGLAKSEFERDWPHLLKLEMQEQVWRRAASLTEAYGLGPSAAMHVASFLGLAADRSARCEFWSPSERRRLAAQAATSEEPSTPAEPVLVPPTLPSLE